MIVESERMGRAGAKHVGDVVDAFSPLFEVSESCQLSHWHVTFSDASTVGKINKESRSPLFVPLHTDSQ